MSNIYQVNSEADLVALLASLNINYSVPTNPEINTNFGNAGTTPKVNILHKSRFLIESITYTLGSAVSTDVCTKVSDTLTWADIAAVRTTWRWDKSTTRQNQARFGGA